VLDLKTQATPNDACEVLPRHPHSST
jgi:hypothetical protein